jgi:aspartate carbamoyltransferase catalytic subunit
VYRHSEGAPTDERIKSLLEIGRIQVERYKGADAWEKAFTAFNLAQDQVSHPSEKTVHPTPEQCFSTLQLTPQKNPNLDLQLLPR